MAWPGRGSVTGTMKLRHWTREELEMESVPGRENCMWERTRCAHGKKRGKTHLRMKNGSLSTFRFMKTYSSACLSVLLPTYPVMLWLLKVFLAGTTNPVKEVLSFKCEGCGSWENRGIQCRLGRCLLDSGLNKALDWEACPEISGVCRI